MLRNIFIALFLIIFPFTNANAQKKELSQAKDWVKKGTNLQQAESSMQKLLKDSVNTSNEKIWLTLFDAVRKQYEQDNEKLYLKQQSDTSKLFINARKMLSLIHI